MKYTTTFQVHIKNDFKVFQDVASTNLIQEQTSYSVCIVTLMSGSNPRGNQNPTNMSDKN